MLVSEATRRDKSYSRTMQLAYMAGSISPKDVASGTVKEDDNVG